MKTRNPVLGLAVWGSALCAASLARGQDFTMMMPELRSLPAPEWVKPGVRLTFYQASASMPSQRYYYWQDDTGDWKCTDGPDVGTRFMRGENPSASGHGIAQIDIVGVDQKEVQLAVLRWGFMDGRVVPFGLSASAAAPATGDDYWLPPKTLAALPEQRTGAFSILRMPYSAAGKQYQTVRIQNGPPEAQSGWNYDLATGVLIHAHTSTVTQGDLRGLVGGYTMLTQTLFLGGRLLQIPWANAAPPAWLASVRRITYEGTYTMNPPGAGMSVTQPCRITADVVARGANWIRYNQNVDIGTAGGMPPSTTTTQVLSGPQTVCGLWIPPSAVPALAVGTLIDRDDLSHVESSVIFNGPLPNGTRGVTIRENGHAHTVNYTYDASGILQAFTSENRNMWYRLDCRLTQVN